MYYQCLGVTFCGRHMYDCILKKCHGKISQRYGHSLGGLRDNLANVSFQHSRTCGTSLQLTATASYISVRSTLFVLLIRMLTYSLFNLRCNYVTGEGKLPFKQCCFRSYRINVVYLNFKPTSMCKTKNVNVSLRQITRNEFNVKYFIMLTLW